MLGFALIRLYAYLLRLYPDHFLNEFGEEMGDVFDQALTGLADSGIPPVIRRSKMIRLFFREVWYFPLAYLDARRYQASVGDRETRSGNPSSREGKVTETWVGRRTPWGTALLGALPFLLFGLAYLLDGLAELCGYNRLAFNLLEGSQNLPAIIFTPHVGVYLICALGLILGVLKGFPRWSYAYLGMSLYFGWSYNQQNYYGLFYKWWVWLPTVAAIVLGLLLARSLKPFARLFQGTWNDWTRLSFALYAFALPMFTVIFFDEDWGVLQLYGLFFDTVLLAAMGVAYLRSRTTWGRVLSLEAAVMILVVKWILGGGFPTFDEPQKVVYFWFLFIFIYFGFLLMPAMIGLLRRGVNTLSSGRFSRG